MENFDTVCVFFIRCCTNYFIVLIHFRFMLGFCINRTENFDRICVFSLFTEVQIFYDWRLSYLDYFRLLILGARKMC